MEEIDIRKQIRDIAREEGTYKEDAYYFVFEALEYTMKKHKREGHVSGRELLDGIRALALEKFGPMTRTVLLHWGIKSTHDFGRIVFILVDRELLGKQPEDSIRDFENVYDFETAFEKPFRY